MDIVIVAQYLLDITSSDNMNSRFVYLANMLKDHHDVEIITSDFIHGDKKHAMKVAHYDGIEITPMHEPGYKRNICLTRFLSHAKLAKNIEKYLRQREKPDVVYCAIPSIDVAAKVSKYCRDNNIRFIIDIQDLWPEAFRMVFNIPIVSDIVFFPLKLRIEDVYKSANGIVAVSETYVMRAKKVNDTAKATVAFLGTDARFFDETPNENRLDDFIRIVYVGSLERSYDLENAIKAVSRCQDVELVVIGDGSLKVEFEKLAQCYEIKSTFLGRLPYSEMVMRMKECDIAINPIRKGSAASIINKVGDYAMAGLPVINTQESAEYRALLDKYECGINCGCENIDDMTNAIALLCSDAILRKKMALNSKKIGKQFFDRSITYQKIVKMIEDR